MLPTFDGDPFPVLEPTPSRKSVPVTDLSYILLLIVVRCRGGRLLTAGVESSLLDSILGVVGTIKHSRSRFLPCTTPPSFCSPVPYPTLDFRILCSNRHRCLLETFGLWIVRKLEHHTGTTRDRFLNNHLRLVDDEHGLSNSPFVVCMDRNYTSVLVLRFGFLGSPSTLSPLV